MCGIIAYIGKKQACQIILDGLRLLQYRGHDSFGLAVCDKNDKIQIAKTVGRLKDLQIITHDSIFEQAHCGIGHVRWATNGAPNYENAHPHASDNHSVVGVHNGIIDNYKDLKIELQRKKYSFYSETDTEVVIKLVDYYKTIYGSSIKAICEMMQRVHGSYALAIMFQDDIDAIWLAKKDSSMFVGEAEDGYLAASDWGTIKAYANVCYIMDNYEIAKLSQNNIVFYNGKGEEVNKERKFFSQTNDIIKKGKFKHFMLKEIYEQPYVVDKIINSFFVDDKTHLKFKDLEDFDLSGIKKITMIGCGSSFYAACLGKCVIEEFAKIPVRVELSSEFLCHNHIYEEGEVVIAISQSGETFDTLAALKLVKDYNIRTLAITNVCNSSIALTADNVIYTKAGPEIAVATTKVFNAQLIICYLLAIKIADVNNVIDKKYYFELVNELKTLPAKIKTILSINNSHHIQRVASKIYNAHDVYFTGRGIDYFIALESSLKMKEVTYIHAEAYAAGELKHGPISLIEKGTIVIGILTQEDLIEKTIMNLSEVRSRGANLIVFSIIKNDKLEEIAEEVIYIPQTTKFFMPSLAIVFMQLLAYWVARKKGTNIDAPRNLAKSITVE